MSKTKILQVFIITLIITLSPILASAASFHSGKIYLQVEANGEAWYIYPVNDNRYYLGRPDDAFSIMRNLGLGISNANLAQIPIGIIQTNASDIDNDGLEDDLEVAIGTNAFSADTDNDDFSDKSEIESWHNPKGDGSLPKNQDLINRLKGRILLQVEKNGEAWYLNPNNNKRYFLGRPANAFAIMRELGIGITNANLSNIKVKYILGQKTLGSNYTLNYPNNWSVSEFAYESDYYNGLTVSYDSIIRSSTDDSYIQILTLETTADMTLGSFNIAGVQNTDKYQDEDFLVDVKPGKKQKFVYRGNVQVGEERFNEGAVLYADIMINTHQFIHFYMPIYESYNIELYEKYFDDVIKNIKL